MYNKLIKMNKKDYVKPVVHVEPLYEETFMLNDSFRAPVYNYEEGGELPDSED